MISSALPADAATCRLDRRGRSVAVVSPAGPDKESGQTLTTDAKPAGPTVPVSEDEKLEVDKRRSNEATQADDTVFLGGESGTLRCQIPDQKPFDVKWEVNDDRGVVTVDGGRTRGSVTGEWSPGPNKIVYGVDVIIAPEGIPQPFSISDAGKLSVDNGTTGTCTPSAH